MIGLLFSPGLKFGIVLNTVVTGEASVAVPAVSSRFLNQHGLEFMPDGVIFTVQSTEIEREPRQFDVTLEEIHAIQRQCAVFREIEAEGVVEALRVVAGWYRIAKVVAVRPDDVLRNGVVITDSEGVTQAIAKVLVATVEAASFAKLLAVGFEPGDDLAVVFETTFVTWWRVSSISRKLKPEP